MISSNLLAAEGRYGEAIQVLESMPESHPELAATLRRRLAILRCSRGEAEQGLAELQALADENPEDLTNWAVLGEQARLEGRLALSRAALDRAASASGQSADPEAVAEVHYQRFRLYKEMRELDEALDAWNEAVSYQSELRNKVSEVYTMLTDAGRYSDALRYVALDENELQAGFQRGLVASLTGRPVDAREEWEAVAGLDLDQFDSGRDCWVEAVLRLGDPESALDALEALLQEDPTPRLLILSGIAHAMVDDGESAALAFEEAIAWLRRQHPPRSKLDSADWLLLDRLVADPELKAPLKRYFAVIERVWGLPGTGVVEP
jgi:tetratricopeptide (TPR) repeat protein